jgi:hypothetical protein
MKARSCPFCGAKVYLDDAALRSYHHVPVCAQYQAFCSGATMEGEVTIIDVPGTRKAAN